MMIQQMSCYPHIHSHNQMRYYFLSLQFQVLQVIGIPRLVVGTVRMYSYLCTVEEDRVGYRNSSALSVFDGGHYFPFQIYGPLLRVPRAYRRPFDAPLAIRAA